MPLSRANIVVVDDEPALLESMRNYLSRLGHDVTAFLGAASAWEYFAANPSACSLIIVDMTMPGMSGGELIRRVFEQSPTISVLAISGYPGSLHDLPAPQDAHIALLEKPFTPAMLAEALERLIGKEPGGAG